MVVARVILKGARSYRVGDRRFIKDVPQVIKGAEVAQYEQNGYFHVAVLKGASKVEHDDDDSADEAPAAKKKAVVPPKAAALKTKATVGLKKRT